MQQPVSAADPLEYSPFGGIAMNAAKLKEQIEKGEYEVDPVAVADAMLRRLRGLAQPGAQNECSKPESSPSASTKATPGSPSTTKPTHVRSASRMRGARAFSSFSALRAGTQTHSS
jgi:hypothetical protein